MALPNVNIKIGNGNLGRVSTSSDGVAGMVLTGVAVGDTLKLNTHYQLSSVRDLAALGVTEENNPLVYKDVKAFYTQAGEGAELHILVVAEATTLSQMTAIDAGAPLRRLLDAAGGRIRLVGINRSLPSEYTPTTTQGIDADAISALQGAQALAEDYAAGMMPVRGFIPAPAWDDTSEDLFKPRSASCNCFALVLASDDATGKTAAIGQILGRAAAVSVQISIARVRDGAIAENGYFTNGKSVKDEAAKLNELNDAGYVFYRTFPTLEGVYLNDDMTAAPETDDYSNLNLGRVMDKVMLLSYKTCLTELMDNVEVDDKGRLPAEVCAYFEGLVKDAIGVAMDEEISGVTVYVNPDQNILATSTLVIEITIVPQGTLRKITVELAFANPYKNS